MLQLVQMARKLPRDHGIIQFGYHKLQHLKGHSDWLTLIALASDTVLVSGSQDKTIKVWNTISGTCLQTLLGHSDIVKSVVVSQDDRQIVSGSQDGTVRLWLKCLME